MSRLGKRLGKLEVKRDGPLRQVLTVMPMVLPEGEEAAFIASERRHLGLGEADQLLCVLTGVPRAGDERWRIAGHERSN